MQQTKRAPLFSSIAIAFVLVSASVTGMRVTAPAAAAAAASPSSQGLPASGATTASNSSTGSLGSLAWTEDTGPGATGVEGWNYSPQTQINSSSVSRLGVSYIFPIPSIWGSTPAWGPCNYINGTAPCRFPGLPYNLNLEGTMAPVLTSGGAAYVVTTGLSVYAFDLADGAGITSDFPRMDWSSWTKQPWAAVYNPGHLHGVNMVDGTIWVPGYGCQLQGWDANSGVLVANLTDLCYNIPGDYSPHEGWGQYYPYGDAEVQVDPASNVILYSVGGGAEGTGQGRAFVEGCSLNDAIHMNVTLGGGCTPNMATSLDGVAGGPCTQPYGGLCSQGSSLLWRTFLFPALDGSTPNFTKNVCDKGHVWVAGVPCQDLPTSLVQNDWQNPSSVTKGWNGTSIGPSSGMSNNWGNFALDNQDGLFFMGTSQAAPDWNASLRPGINMMAESILGVSLTNGSIAWADKSIAKDFTDLDCNLNLTFAQVGSQKMVLKACKSAVIYGISALTGQPDWILDTTMPDYNTLGSSTTPFSQPFECSPTNVTSCDFGAMWDKIWSMYDGGSLKMVGSDPHPHGYVQASPYRGAVSLDPLNATEMSQFTCVLGTNAECQAVAGVGEHLGCPEFANTTESRIPTCPAFQKLGKQGFLESRYLMETENAFDGKYFYVVVMSGPMEQDWISDVQYKGTSGLTFGANLYFSGTMPTNATVLAINPANGHVVWNYTRPIYYRGSILATGGMVVTQWPDGHMIFLNRDTGTVVRDMYLGLPLVAPMSIGPDATGAMHLLITYGGSNHPVLGMVGLHGQLGHGLVAPGAVISLALGPAPTGASVPAPQPSVGVYNDAFYVLLGSVVVLAVIAGAFVVNYKRGGRGVSP